MNNAMCLYVCKSCGYFRDMTHITGLMSITLDNIVRSAQYNTSITHCHDCKVEMYQVQKGDRLAVLPAVTEEGRKDDTSISSAVDRPQDA